MDKRQEGDELLAYWVERAREIALIHPQVRSVGNAIKVQESAAWQVEVTFEVPMPTRWRVAGQSPLGVRHLESVRFEFNHGCPVYPPELSLRPDFSRDFAHVMPWLTDDGRPVPCVVEGRLSDFFLREGMAGLLNQTVLWLEHAAEGALIDPSQGWEPTRRDHLSDYIISADSSTIRGLVDKKGGYAFFRYDYAQFVAPSGSRFHCGIMGRDPQGISKKALLEFALVDNEAKISRQIGQSAALVVWPGKEPSGALKVCDVYAPETVASVADLKKRAALFGCHRELEAALAWVKQCAALLQSKDTVLFPIILCARRPFHLIGSDSPIEICPYIVDVSFPLFFPKGDQTAVLPAAHRDLISRPLLARMSGIEMKDNLNWSLVGAGSLGSKIALHLARTGRAPAVIVDDASMSMHNAARHGLLPPSTKGQLNWMRSKATLLAEAIEGFDQKAEAIDAGIGTVLRNDKLTRKLCSKDTWAVVNSTASEVAREVLAAAPLDTLPVRVIETTLYAEGRLALIAAEGPKRNPNVRDLIAEFYTICQQDPDLQQLLFREKSVHRTSIGQGCGSLTMPMTDSRISLSAAGVAEYLIRAQDAALPPSAGEIVVGHLSGEGFGMQWRRFPAPATILVRPENSDVWSISLHERANAKIVEEVGRHPTMETGGIIVGRISNATRTLNIVDCIEAPTDSVRSPTEFILGVTGVKRVLGKYVEDTGGALYCLGTWHSHLQDSGPSNLDRQAAKALALARIAPSILLIHTPAGYRALVADRVEAKGSL